MAQLVVRIDDSLLAELDLVVASGGAASRSDAARRGLELMIDSHRRAEVGRRIAAGYGRVPQHDDDDLWSDRATAEMIAHEPW